MSEKPDGNVGYAIHFDMTGYSSFKIRLKNRREKLGMSQIDLANKIGVNKGTIQNYEYGKPPKGDNLVKIAQVLKCRVAWLLNSEEPEDEIQHPPQPRRLGVQQGIAYRESQKRKKISKDENGVNIPQWENPDPDMYHYIPMAEATLNAGGGSFVLSEKTTGRYYAFRKNFLSFIASSPKNLILMKVTGDSMKPKIEDGDTVMIDVGKRQLKNGAIYALGYDDVIVIKEIEKLPGGKALIISKNRTMYPPYETDIRNIRIIGQVIWGDRIFAK